MNDHNENLGKSLKISYLLMADTIDRLDMILLELRHLQRNIIYFMHEPGFNAPLRFEEEFLFGDKWKESFSNFSTSKYDKIDEIIQDNILLFPTLKETSERKLDDEYKENAKILLQKNRDREEIKKIITDVLQERVSCLWKDEWAMRHGRSYEHLRGTQLLKRIIVKDKMKFLLFSLNHVGLTAGEHKEEDIKPDRLAQFIIFRDAVQHRSRQYLERLMEYQSLFNKTLDIGVKDFPVPSLERRREIGIYMDFLDDRVKGICKQIDHLVHRLFERKKNEYVFNKLKERSRDIILHSWKHHFTSEHHFQKSNSSDSCNVHHITTNYWMPERVDLQPMIAHEIAHLVLHHYFDNLSDNFFQSAENSSFANLLRSLFRVCRRYANMGLEEENQAHRPRFLISEIACDLLASSVKGFSYLYASLLEATGNELYKLLLSGNRDFDNDPVNIIDLDMIHFLSGSGIAQRRDWWLRLKIMICWLKAIHHVDEGYSKLDNILLDGADCLLDNLIIFLDEITPSREDKRGAVWRSLAERLCEEIKDSQAVNAVKKWRKDRFHAARWNEEDQNQKGKIIFPRSVKRLHPEVVETMKKVHIGIKTKPWNALAFCKENLADEFNKKYIVEEKQEYSDRYIYNHLYDIPWKCSLSRTIDVFNKYNGNDSPQKRTLDFLRNNAIGQELHSIAMEFHIMLSENPIDMLTHVIRLIDYQKNLTYYFNNSPLEEVRDIAWHKSTGNILKESREKRICKEYYDNKGKAEIRELEKKAERRLDDFSKIFNQIKEEKDKAALAPLHNYIASHTKKDEVIQIILNEITHIHTAGEKECALKIDKERNSDNPLRCFRMLLVSRYIASGFYATQKDQNDDVFTSKKELNAVSLLKGASYWFHPEKEDDLKKGEQDKWPCCCWFNDRRYANFCGRYDAMSFVRTRPIHSCIIPHFEEHIKDKDGKKLSEYTFPSLLVRREFGIKVDLNFINNCKSLITRDNKSKDMLAGYISIVLKRRSLRIPFLARLLASVELDKGDIQQQDKQNKLREHIQIEEKLKRYIKDTDTAFLLDGSADFLLVLRRGEKEDFLTRVGNLMDLSYWLHQDFMVDRTEIILSAAALDYVAEDISTTKKESKYSIECEIRCFEDRFLDDSLADFIKGIRSEIKYSNGKSEQSSKDKELNLLVTVEIAAGRKDVLLRFFNENIQGLPHAELWRFDTFREGLKKLLQPVIRDQKGKPIKDENGNELRRYDFVDRIEVNVNKKEPEETR